jgi:class 3 adenylate cyclase
MNTAARMESNGRPNCIHVSEATADQLILAGKKSWLSTRIDKITAKGKGEMQTYWVDDGRKSAVTKGASSQLVGSNTNSESSYKSGMDLEMPIEP